MQDDWNYFAGIDLDYRIRYENKHGAITAVVDGKWRRQTGPDSWSEPLGIFDLHRAGPYKMVGRAPKPYVNPHA